MIARVLATAAICSLFSGAAMATTFTVQKAISMDQWVHWPGPQQWNDPGVIDNFPEWRANVSDEQLRYLRESGLDTVRLPVDPGFILYDGDTVRTYKIFAGIEDAIVRLRNAGLNVLVDMHTIGRGDSGAIGIEHILNDPSTFDRYTDLLKTMAARLADYDPAHVALEVINEPNLDCKDSGQQAQWARQQQTLHAAARSANPAITLVLSGACHGSAEGLDALDPSLINDDNTLWSFHHYQPFKLTHQSASWAGPWVQHIANIPYPPTALSAAQTEALIEENQARITEALAGPEAVNIINGTRYDIQRLTKPDQLRAEMEDPFQMIAAWADRNRIARSRIFMGEFGMIRQEWERPAATDPQWRINYIKDMTQLASQYGFGWSMWSFGGAFGMVQGFSGEALENPLVDDVLN